jgi:hypothetical protein
MSVTPYSPFGKLEKQVSQDRMQEILHRNSLKAAQSPQAKTEASYDLKRLDHEMRLAKRLGEHGQNVFTGDTDRNARRERFRKAIKDAGFECVIVGRAKNGEPETYESCFARLFGEPL